MREGRELLLEELVLGAVPVDGWGAAAPGAGARGARAQGGSERGVTREPEVIIAREVDEPPPAVERHRARVGCGERLDRGARAPQLELRQPRELRLKCRCDPLHGPRR